MYDGVLSLSLPFVFLIRIYLFICLRNLTCSVSKISVCLSVPGFQLLIHSPIYLLIYPFMFTYPIHFRESQINVFACLLACSFQ